MRSFLFNLLSCHSLPVCMSVFNNKVIRIFENYLITRMLKSVHNLLLSCPPDWRGLPKKVASCIMLQTNWVLTFCLLVTYTVGSLAFKCVLRVPKRQAWLSCYGLVWFGVTTPKIALLIVCIIPCTSLPFNRIDHLLQNWHSSPYFSWTCLNPGFIMKGSHHTLRFTIADSIL
jgi:hypothetical protein